MQTQPLLHVTSFVAAERSGSAFSITGPHTWNELPSQLHAIADFWATIFL